jgi:hypothetical protein
MGSGEPPAAERLSARARHRGQVEQFCSHLSLAFDSADVCHHAVAGEIISRASKPSSTFGFS